MKHPIYLALCILLLNLHSFAQTSEQLTADTLPDSAPRLLAKVEENVMYGRTERMPLFRTCEPKSEQYAANKKCSDEALITFIKGLKYPKKASVKGTCIVQFEIDEQGKLSKLRLVRDIGGGCGAQALCDAKLLPTDWTPGTINGKPVAVKYHLPFRFRLQD